MGRYACVAEMYWYFFSSFAQRYTFQKEPIRWQIQELVCFCRCMPWDCHPSPFPTTWWVTDLEKKWEDKTLEHLLCTCIFLVEDSLSGRVIRKKTPGSCSCQDKSTVPVFFSWHEMNLLGVPYLAHLRLLCCAGSCHHLTLVRSTNSGASKSLYGSLYSCVLARIQHHGSPNSLQTWQGKILWIV